MEKLYLEIRKIAEQQKNGETMTRADLAFALKKHGIHCDSPDVSRLVYEAWLHFKQHKGIYRAFVTNDKNDSVVASYAMNYAAASRDTQGLVRLSEARSDKGGKALKELKENTRNVLDASDPDSPIQIRSLVTGSIGAEQVQAVARSAYERYTELVGAYDTACAEVKAAMSDFVFLRTQMNDILRRYTMSLLDIFGDSVRAIDPQMFDFDAVEWLDVKRMLESTRLEYNSISSSCSTLIQEITENFGSALRSSVQLYRSSGNRNTGIALMAMGMLSHYLGSAERTAALKKELLLFTDKIKKDAMTIQGDTGRLAVIYRTVTELYLPKANAFYRYADEVLTEELEQLLESIYADETVRQIKNKRDALLAALRETETKILDARINIDSYNAGIAATRELLESNRSNYREAVSLRPSKPFFLWNILTFGGAGRRFNRDLTEWYEHYADAVKYYENLLVDIKMDQDEVKTLTLELNRHTAASRKNKAELHKISEEMRRTLLVSGADKGKIADHLESIVQLLRIAKDIVSSGLDERHIRAVRPAEYTSPELPEHIRQSISALAQEVRGQAPENELIQRTVSLFERYAELQAMQQASRLSDAAYAKKLQQLQHEFQSEMEHISARGDILRESLIRINTAQNTGALREALPSLSGASGPAMSEETFRQFLKGEIKIEI